MHKNHAICYTFNTCTAQWSATRRTQLTTPVRGTTDAPQTPLLSRGPRSQSKRPQRVRKWRKKNKQKIHQSALWTQRGAKKWNLKCFCRQKGFKLTEGRMILRFVTATRPWQSPSPTTTSTSYGQCNRISGLRVPFYAPCVHSPIHFSTPLLFGMAFICLAFHLAVNATLSRFSTLTTTCHSFNCLLPRFPL